MLIKNDKNCNFYYFLLFYKLYVIYKCCLRFYFYSILLFTIIINFDEIYEIIFLSKDFNKFLFKLGLQ